MKAHDHLHSQNGYSGLRRQYQTYVRVGGAWRYPYRAVNGTGQTVDFLLSAKRDKVAAKRFLRRALGRDNTRNPWEIVTDRLKSYPGAIRDMKRKRRLSGALRAG
jgi:transposase-like protein